MPPAVETELSKLDQLLTVLAHAPESEQARIAEEHARSARNYLLGAMPQEFALNLEMTRQAIAGIPDREAREAAEEIARDLMEQNKIGTK